MTCSRSIHTRSTVRWLTLCLTLGLSGCTLAPQPRLPSRTVDTEKACADWRWIGMSRPGARCPQVAGWAVHPLFPQLAPAPPVAACGEDLDAPEPVASAETLRELSRFCVYEIADPKRGLRDVPFPPAVSADLDRFDPDCAALALADTALSSQPLPPDVEGFLAHASGLEEPLEIQGQLGVRLAFLDTQPTGEGLPQRSGRSLHGYTLAHLASSLVCAPGSNGHCAAQITTRLALPILEFDPRDPEGSRIDPVNGGYLGMQSDLAEAIRNEVDAWWPKRESQRHLVLNLSMAWDGTLFGGLDAEQIADLRAGTQAVYRALEYARGFDVLVLAAAGNQKKEPCANVGPLLPAAWEIRAPLEDRCRQAETGPLLYAVGGVGADGSRLANARDGAMPRRAAYGETELYVGTSVSTAVASSIAAVVWDTFPDLTSRCVMQILDGTELDAGCRTGREAGPPDNLLAMRADFWHGMGSRATSHEAPLVRKLTLCSVLAKACKERPSAACPLRSKCAAESFTPVALRRSLAGGVETKGSCQPWLYPQPESDPCPTCPPSP